MSHRRGAVALVAAVIAVMLTAVPTAYAEMIAGTFAWNPPPYAPGTHHETSFSDVVAGPAGSVYVVGAYNGMAYAASGIVARVNGTTGAKMWALTTKGPGGGGVFWYEAAKDGGGNVVAVGTASLNRLGLVKYSPSGVLKWSRWLGAPTVGRDVAAGPSSTVYAVGGASRSGRGGDGLLVKYAADGRLLWKSYLSTTRTDMLDVVTVDARGNAYALGERNATRTSNQLALVKVTAAGHVAWTRTIAATGTMFSPVAVLRTSTGAIVVANRSSGGESHALIAKYSTSGTRVWKCIDNERVSEVADAAVLGDGTVVVVGSRFDESAPAEWVGVVSIIGAAGLPVGHASYYEDLGAEGVRTVEFAAVTADSQGRVYVAGTAIHESGDTGEGTAIVLRFPEPLEGQLLPDVRWAYRGASNVYGWSPNEFRALCVAGSGGVYAAGVQSALAEGLSKGLVERLRMPPD